MPHQLSRILLYPIKSLDGVAVETASILSGGALQGDREFTLVDQAGRIINGKRNPKIHRVRSHFHLSQRLIELNRQGETTTATFHLDQQRSELEAWFTDYFEQPVRLIQNLETGFPDDPDSPGPTIVSEASLEAVTSWYPELNIEDIRRRFRTNLELGSTEPFWEDHLFGESDTPVPFAIGDVRFLGINPCQRCPVPTRDPDTGEPLRDFQKVFVAQRQQTLPAGVVRSRFNHFYHLTVNTQVPSSETGKMLHVGDTLQLSGHPGAA